jgi:4-hydroxybenzoate polyprenyltransferase
VRRLLTRISPALHLARVTTAFAAVANVWFVILWTHASRPREPATAAFDSMPLWALLAGGAVNALALFAFATTLNDVLDYRRDQFTHPERPIPSGRVSVDGAITLVVCTLGAAVLGATVLGTQAVLLTLLIAGAILFFNAAGKYIPGVGLVVLGLIYAGQAVIPNLNLRFVWPVWLIMTHALLIGAAAHIAGQKSPALSTRAVLFAGVGWAFWSGVMLAVGWARNRGEGGLWPDWVKPSAVIGPVLLIVLFAALSWRRVILLGRGPRAAEKIARYGALWLALYACAWMLGQNYAAGALILIALTTAGFLGMTILREIYVMLEHPMGYRR